jgi:hypothetical protein
MLVKSQAHLLEIVLALRATRRLATGLHGRQQQAHQHANNGNDNQQLDEGKATAQRHVRASSHCSCSCSGESRLRSLTKRNPA